jgi:hypothetical protein
MFQNIKRRPSQKNNLFRTGARDEIVFIAVPCLHSGCEFRKLTFILLMYAVNNSVSSITIYSCLVVNKISTNSILRLEINGPVIVKCEDDGCL